MRISNQGKYFHWSFLVVLAEANRMIGVAEQGLVVMRANVIGMKRKPGAESTLPEHRVVRSYRPTQKPNKSKQQPYALPKYKIGLSETRTSIIESVELREKTPRPAITIKKIPTPIRSIRMNKIPNEKPVQICLHIAGQVQKVEENRSPSTQDREGEKLKVEGVLTADEEAEERLHEISALFERHMEKKTRGILLLVLLGGRNPESMARAWSKLSESERRHGFRFVAGYLLRKRYSRFCARLIVCSCLQDIRPPVPEDVALVLEYIIHLELSNHKRPHRRGAAPWRKEQEGKASKFIDLTLALLRVDYGGAFRLRQSTIFRLVRSACLKDVSRLYDGLRETKSRLSINTMLHFVERLSGPSTWTKAYSIMELISNAQDRNMNLPQIWKIFHTLFYKATFIGEKESSAVVRMMLDCDISPGRPAYNILMTKASRNKEEENLMQVFRQMTEAGLKPSVVTYGILHNYYKQQGIEAERRQVMRDALQLHPHLNTIIATDIVHATSLGSPHYPTVLDEYLNYFIPGPLVSLGIAMTEHNIPRGSTSRKKLKPDHLTIAIMVHAFCMREDDPMVIWAAYQRYRTALEAERSHGRLGSLHEAASFLPNSYMLALGCFDTLWYCATIIEDMLKPNSPIQANVYSWSILLYAMAKARKIKEAEQILGAMKRKGIQPNVVTWTSLLTGYVRMGRLRNAGEVIRRMAAENVNPNYATMGLLASVIDDKEFVAGMTGETIEGERIEDFLKQR